MVGLKITLKYGTYCQFGNFHSLFLFVCFDLNIKKSTI